MTVRIIPLPEPAAPPVPDGGLGALSTEKGNLPLDSVDVHAAVSGLAASVTVVQGFRNPYDVPLEATYVFPLPDRAAVTSLRMEAADRVVDGVLKERGQARQEYDTAIASGRRAAIAEEDRPDVFTMRVGNILPGERVTLRLVLNQPLPFEAAPSGASAGEATFRFPLVVAPRYIPGAALDEAAAGTGVAADTDAVPDASRITPPVLLPGFPNPVALSLAVDIDPAALPLTEIRSALHVVAEDSTGEGPHGRVTVRLHPGERLNRDFILRLVYATPAAGEASLALTPDAEGDEGTFTLTVLPSAETGPARPRDVVLVLDRSYSMQGWKMVAARRAAARIVDTFTPDDRFAVMSFDNSIEFSPVLGAALSPGTDRNRFRAVEYLATVKARGGTEMLRPLEQAAGLLHQPGPDRDRDRVLVLVTDGQVGNEDQILDHLTPALQDVRVHTVGIDQAVNAGFLNRLASVGGGHCELVESEDRLDEAMERVHHRVGSPLVTDLSLRPDGLNLLTDTIAPQRLGAIFPGVPLVVTGRYRGSAAGTVVLEGRGPDGSPREHHARAVRTDAPMAAALWARAHLRDLEDSYAARGSHDLEKRIVDTSLRFGVLCRFTAFVAVDTRVATDGGTPHRVTQPVELPAGWDETAGYGMAAPASAAAYGAAPMAPGAPPAAGAAAVPPAPRAMPSRSSGPSRGSSRRSFRRSYFGENLVEDDVDVPDFLKGDSPASAPASPPSPPSPAPRARRRADRAAGSEGASGAPGNPPAPKPGARPSAPDSQGETHGAQSAPSIDVNVQASSAASGQGFDGSPANPSDLLPDASALAWPWNTVREEIDRMEAVAEADQDAYLFDHSQPFLNELFANPALDQGERDALKQALRLLKFHSGIVQLIPDKPDRVAESRGRTWGRVYFVLTFLVEQHPPTGGRASFWKRPR